MVSEEIADQIEKAIVVLKDGGVVVFPTETAYGLAADATNPTATVRVSLIKGRLEEKNLPLIASDREMVERVAGIPRGLNRLAEKFWPGPLTLILPVLDSDLSPAVIKNGEIAIRVSSHEVAHALAKGVGGPIISTSANVSGKPACYSIEEVKAQFAGQDMQPDAYIDIGKLAPELPSTIVTVDDYGYPDVLRQGSIDIYL